MIAAMRVSMPMAEFVAWLAGSGLAGLMAGMFVSGIMEARDRDAMPWPLRILLLIAFAAVAGMAIAIYSAATS